MKSTFKTKLNRLLKYLGITVSRPKRVRARKASYRVHVPIEDANTGKTHYVGDDCPGGQSDCDPHVAVGYVSPSSTDARKCGKVNYVTHGEHNTCIGPVEQPSSDNNITGPTS